jgi:hypothetical protein
MSMRITRTLVVCSAFALLLAQAADAQNSTQNTALSSEQAAVEANAVATASATSYAPIPKGAALDVSTGQTTEMASNAVQLTSGTLELDGYKISRDARFALDVNAQLVRGVGQEQRVPRATQGSVRGDRYNDAEKGQGNDSLVQGNLFDNTRGAILSPAEPQTGGHLLRVSLAVYDRTSGLYVWRGQIERDSIEVDVDSSMQQMVPALLKHFGQNLAPTAVPLK